MDSQSNNMDLSKLKAKIDALRIEFALSAGPGSKSKVRHSLPSGAIAVYDKNTNTTYIEKKAPKSG